MTPYEQDDIRSILRRVHSPEIVSRWNINERVAETLLEISAQIGNCSKVMDLIPRPMPAGSRSMRYISKEARRALIRQLKDDESYIICIKAASAGYRTQFEEASAGY